MSARQVFVDRSGSATARRDRVDDRLGARHDVTPGEDTGMAGREGPRVGDDPGERADLDARPFGQDRRIRFLADRHQDGRRRDGGLAARDRCPDGAAALDDACRGLLGDPELRRGPVGPKDFGHDRADPEGDPLGPGRLDLLGLSRHLREPAPVKDRHGLRPAPKRGPGRIHGRAATAHDDDRTRQARVLAEVDLLEEDRSRDDAAELVARHTEASALGCSGGEEDGLVALALEVAQGVVTAHDRIEPELDAKAHDPIDLGPQGLARQPVLRDADRHHPAGDGHRLKNGDAVSEADEVVGGRHAGRPTADDGDALDSADGRWFDWRQGAVLGGEALERPDRDRLIEGAPTARCLARSRADPAADRRERIDLGRNRIRLVIAALGDQADIPPGVRSGRAGRLARGRGLRHLVADHRRPDLPRLRSAAGPPPAELVERGDLGRFQRFTCDRGPRDPAAGGLRSGDRALAQRERRRALDRHELHDRDGALLDADRAADALADLDRMLHDPGQGHAARPGLDPRLVGTGHVESLDGADVHADTAVDAFVVVDVDPVAHRLPPLRTSHPERAV